MMSLRRWAARLPYTRSPAVAARAASGCRISPSYTTTTLPRHFSARPAVRQQLSSNEVFHSQLENAGTSETLSSLKTPQTLVEKIVQRHSVGLPEGKRVHSSDYVTLQPFKCMTHDNSWPVRLKFGAIGASKILDNRQVVMTLDHDVQNKSEANLKKYRQIEEFAKSQGVDFYPAGRGIGHQIMVEEHYAWPQTLCVASDSHSTHYGGVGCLGFAVVRTDAAAIWATGKSWFCIPPVARVTLKGTLPAGVTGKDVIIALAGIFNNDEVLNHAIEFAGSEETLRSLPVDSRTTISNQCTEWGALAAIWPVDDVLTGWLRARATDAAMHGSLPGSDSNTASRITHERIDELAANVLTADKGAKYAKNLYLDLSTLSPYVAGPNSVRVATPLKELEAQKIKVDRAYLVSCTNSRASDIAAAAKVVKEAAEKNGGKIPKFADGVSFYIAAASIAEQTAAEEAGDWQALLDAGAMPLPSGCGPCIGLGTGLLQPGEVGVSASNRNFKGRMGHVDAKAYLASPEIVAASALSGTISGPGWYKSLEGWKGVQLGEGDGIKEEDRMITADEALDKIIGQLDQMIVEGEADHGEASSSSAEASQDQPKTELLPGFPEKISGEIVFCDADGINTDGIYPGSLTYKDDVSPEDMAAACMSNYDKGFNELVRPDDILVSGFAFGVGSSREQAATAILAKGVPLVVAGSFSNIFSRNSINNALMTLEVPKLVQRLREAFAEKKPTRRTGWTLTWDVRRSLVEIKEGGGGKVWTQKVGDLPANVQDIIAKGGLEKWVKAELGKTA